ncbi:hypothetical protein ES702_02607 [subsurface metagenome]
MIKIEDKEPLDYINPTERIDLTIELPRGIIDIIEKLSKWSGKSKEKIIIRFIFCELELLTGDNDALCEYLESFIEEITDSLHDFNINYNLGYHEE